MFLVWIFNLLPKIIIVICCLFAITIVGLLMIDCILFVAFILSSAIFTIINVCTVIVSVCVVIVNVCTVIVNVCIA